MAEVMPELQSAHQFAFHEQMKPCYISFSLMSKNMSKSLGGKSDMPDSNFWSKGIAGAYSSSDAFSEFLETCIHHSFIALSKTDAVLALEGFDLKSSAKSVKAEDTLRAAQEYLLRNQDSSKWLSLVLFGLSRAISVTAKSSFDSNEWTDFSLFSMQLEKALVAGDGKSLSRMLCKDMKSYIDDFPARVGLNMPIGLATMAALEPDSAFFDGINRSSMH
jgi:hypothetical protein